MLPINGQVATSRGSLPVLRIAQGTSVDLVIQSTAPLWANVHWLGRQLMCAGDGCVCCDYVPVRTRGFFIATSEVQNQAKTVLVEISPRQWERCEELSRFLAAPLGPGARVTLSKRTKKSPIRLEPGDDQGEVDPAYSHRRVTAAAAAILHQLEPPRPDEILEHWAKRVRTQANLLLATAMKRQG